MVGKKKYDRNRRLIFFVGQEWPLGFIDLLRSNRKKKSVTIGLKKTHIHSLPMYPL